MGVYLCVCFILHYSVVLLYDIVALCEALRMYMDLCYASTILTD